MTQPATTFDEYAYLEEQVEKAVEEGASKEEKSKDKDREDRHKDRKSRHRSRSRSRDRDRKDRKDRSRHRSRSRSRSRDRKDRRRRSRSRSRDRSSRHKESRKPRQTSEEREAERQLEREKREAEERQRELEELDRDTRTVFAYNLSTKAGERDIFEFFSQAGGVLDVRIIYDRNTPKSKGMAYIEMAQQTDIPACLSLTGQMLKGQVVMVKASEAEKNVAWEVAQQQKANPGAAVFGMNGLVGQTAGPCKLAVSGVHPNVLEADLMDIFKPFGEVDFLLLSKDDPAATTHHGHGFVQYKTTAAGMQAIQQLNNLELAGNKLQVAIAPVLPGLGSVPGMAAMGMPGMAGMGLPGMMTGMPGMPGAFQPPGMDAAALDDDKDGLKLSAATRASLMQRLAGGAATATATATSLPGPPKLPGMAGAAPSFVGGIPTSMPGPPAIPGMPGMAGAGASGAGGEVPMEQGLLGAPSPIPTECLLLKNLFDPTTETEEDWHLDIAEDVKEECGKHGPVDHIFVDKDSRGFVYLKFATTQGSMAAQQALNARWFARRMIVAEFQFVAVYNTHFGL